MTAAPEPLIRLAQSIERRITELALEYSEVCRRAEISDETLSKIRKGMRARSATYRKLERALEWQQGSIAGILAGGEPAPAAEAIAVSPASDTTSPPHSPSLEQELELAARLMAAQVRELGLSPDEAAEAWRRAQERIVQSHEAEGDARRTNDLPEEPKKAHRRQIG